MANNPQVNLTKTFVCSKLGYGCMSLSPNIYVPDPSYNEDVGISVIKRAIELGVTHFDSALVYGMGQNEEVVGKAIKGYPREKLQIATKCGIRFDPETKRIWISGEPAYVREACMGCLKRLDTPYIDIFYLHRIDTEIPIEETMKELKKLVEEGYIKHIGLSEASAKTIARAHAIHPVTAVQMEYSLFARDVEKDIIPMCRKLGIGIVAYSPLGRGVLTGAIKSVKDLKPGDWRLNNPRFKDGALEKNSSLAEKVVEMAGKKNCSPGQLSLAWVMAQGDDICPIPGTSKIPHLEDNAKALDIKLTKEEVDSLSALIPESEISGTRYDVGSNTHESN